MINSFKINNMGNSQTTQITAAGNLSDDLENWMSKLPDKLKAKSIVELAIPGELYFLFNLC